MNLSGKRCNRSCRTYFTSAHIKIEQNIRITQLNINSINQWYTNNSVVLNKTAAPAYFSNCIFEGDTIGARSRVGHAPSFSFSAGHAQFAITSVCASQVTPSSARLRAVRQEQQRFKLGVQTVASLFPPTCHSKGFKHLLKGHKLLNVWCERAFPSQGLVCRAPFASS